MPLKIPAPPPRATPQSFYADYVPLQPGMALEVDETRIVIDVYEAEPPADSAVEGDA